jgi:hypothetical protein
MVIRFCTSCAFHEIRSDEEGNKKSHCGKENCWSMFSKCLSNQALRTFLEREAEFRTEGSIGQL